MAAVMFTKCSVYLPLVEKIGCVMFKVFSGVSTNSAQCPKSHFFLIFWDFWLIFTSAFLPNFGCVMFKVFNGVSTNSAQCPKSHFFLIFWYFWLIFTSAFKVSLMSVPAVPRSVLSLFWLISTRVLGFTGVSTSSAQNVISRGNFSFRNKLN